jgi:hypothetical protein
MSNKETACISHAAMTAMPAADQINFAPYDASARHTAMPSSTASLVTQLLQNSLHHHHHHHHHVTNQAIASMPSTPRPTGAEGKPNSLQTTAKSAESATTISPATGAASFVPSFERTIQVQVQATVPLQDAAARRLRTRQMPEFRCC